MREGDEIRSGKSECGSKQEKMENPEDFRIEEESEHYAPLAQRTRAFALRVIRMVQSLALDEISKVLTRQLLRSATSVGANYRAARRARSRAEFIAKLGIVEEEADETIYWLELLADAGCVKAHRLDDLIQEANELLAIVVSSIKKARPPK